MKAKLVALSALLFFACANDENDAPIYSTASVERRSIEVSGDSSGVVEPLAAVEVKSKASGEVLDLLVDIGDYIVEGALLVHIDPRTVGNRFAQEFT